MLDVYQKWEDDQRSSFVRYQLLPSIIEMHNTHNKWNLNS